MGTMCKANASVSPRSFVASSHCYIFLYITHCTHPIYESKVQDHDPWSMTHGATGCTGRTMLLASPMLMDSQSDCLHSFLIAVLHMLLFLVAYLGYRLGKLCSHMCRSPNLWGEPLSQRRLEAYIIVWFTKDMIVHFGRYLNCMPVFLTGT